MNTASGSTGSEEAAGSASISISSLRQQLSATQDRLESRGLSASFVRAVKSDPIGDTGFLSSLVFHAILGGSLDMLGEYVPDGLLTDFNGAAVQGGIEGFSALRDVAAHERLVKRSASYPKGRRKDIMRDKTRSQFRRASANQNSGFSFETQADLGAMFEIMDMLDRLERQGTKDAPVTQSQNVYGVRRVSANKGLKSSRALQTSL